jgi:hypothetical protein
MNRLKHLPEERRGKSGKSDAALKAFEAGLEFYRVEGALPQQTSATGRDAENRLAKRILNHRKDSNLTPKAREELAKIKQLEQRERGCRRGAWLQETRAHRHSLLHGRAAREAS